MHCHNCETEHTPMWRRTLDTETDTIVTLCNACGLYYKTKGQHRPTVLISKKNSLSTTELLDKILQAESPVDNKLVVKDLNIKHLNIIHCANCQNINTSIWRKDNEGRSICNACGLYYKKKGVHRVVKKQELSKNEDVFLEIDDNLIRFNRIKRRKRSSVSSSVSIGSSEKPLVQKSPVISTGSASPIVSSNSSAIEESPQPTPLAPLKRLDLLSTPHLLLPDTNYSLSTTSSLGNSIGQYHFDYSSRSESTTSSVLTRPATNNSINNGDKITLPPINSILKI